MESNKYWFHDGDGWRCDRMHISDDFISEISGLFGPEVELKVRRVIFEELTPEKYELFERFDIVNELMRIIKR